MRFLALIEEEGSLVRLWRSAKLKDGEASVTVYYPLIVEGNKVLRPGLKFKIEGSPLDRIDFASLMLALFLGTAADNNWDMANKGRHGKQGGSSHVARVMGG